MCENVTDGVGIVYLYLQILLTLAQSRVRGTSVLTERLETEVNTEILMTDFPGKGSDVYGRLNAEPF